MPAIGHWNHWKTHLIHLCGKIQCCHGGVEPQTFDFFDGLDIDGSFSWHPKGGVVLSPWKHHWKPTPACATKIQMRVGKIKPTPNSRLSSAAMELPSWNRPRMTSDIHWHPVEVGSWFFTPLFRCDFTGFFLEKHHPQVFSYPHFTEKKNSKQLPVSTFVFSDRPQQYSPL